MNRDGIVAAKNEAKRFLICVAKFHNRIADDEEFYRYWNITGGKETAAIKRASLDLTRALSAMRGAKP